MVSPWACHEALFDADGLAEIESVGEKDAQLRYYNVDDPLNEGRWIAGVVSEAFGRKVRPLPPIR